MVGTDIIPLSSSHSIRSMFHRRSMGMWRGTSTTWNNNGKSFMGIRGGETRDNIYRGISQDTGKQTSSRNRITFRLVSRWRGRFALAGRLVSDPGRLGRRANLPNGMGFVLLFSVSFVRFFRLITHHHRGARLAGFLACSVFSHVELLRQFP